MNEWTAIQFIGENGSKILGWCIGKENWMEKLMVLGEWNSFILTSTIFYLFDK